MDDPLIPCHACGRDNPISATACANPKCRATLCLVLRFTTATQCIQLTSKPIEYSKEDLISEAYITAMLLTQAAYRLKALLDATTVENA